MKTITRTITLYTAAELKEAHPKAFQKALERYNDGHDDFWHDAVYSDFLAIAGLMGFDTDQDKIQWSGFSSQGDGASFTGSAAFTPDALEKVQDYAPQDERLHRIAAECSEYGRQGIHARLYRNSHHYSHENTVSGEFCWLDSEETEQELPHCIQGATLVTEENVLGTCRDLMQWLYRQLEKEYEYRCSKECFLETAEANEWTFTAEGKMDHE